MRDWQKDWKTCQAATPGPWVAWKYVPGSWTVSHAEPPNSVDICLMYHNDNTKNNADFIAEAREALPYWLQRVKELEAQAAVLREALKEFEWVCIDDSLQDRVEQTKKARKALALDAGRNMLERVRKLEAVAEAAQAVINEWDNPADGAFNADVLEQLRAALGTPQESVINRADAIIEDLVWLWREYVWANPETLTQDARKLADRLRLVVYDLSESVADLPERALAAPEGGE